MFKRTIFVLLLASLAGSSLFAQKFTKRELARREAREAYYFCGATFTFSAGYIHSWLANKPISNDYLSKGHSEYWANTDNSFDLGFAWDQCFNKQWGLQNAIYYVRKGGDHLHYYDGELGYGKILRPEETDEVTCQGAEWQCQVRYFFNLSKHQRLSLNVGGFIDKHFDKPSGYKNWDMGPQVGIGYDLYRFSGSVTYQPGVFKRVVNDCKSTQGALMVNLGVRVWKK